MKILVVDDRVDNNKLLSMMLRRVCHAEVVSAFTVQQARELWNSNPDINVMVCDVEMPNREGEPIDLTGESLISFVREVLSLHKGIRVIANSSSENHNKKLMALGCEKAFLWKPPVVEYLSQSWVSAEAGQS